MSWTVFKQPKAPKSEPKNIEHLMELSKPIAHRQRKKVVIPEEGIGFGQKEFKCSHDYPPMKNVEIFEELAKPLHKNRKFLDRLADEEAAEAKRKKRDHHDLPPCKNLAFFEELSKPSSIRKKISYADTKDIMYGVKM